MKTRRELLMGTLLGFSTVIAAARPDKAVPLEVTYYFLPG